MHPKTQRKIGWISAGSIVVANMVGTGAFTTLGLQLEHIHSTWAILSLWIFGGVIALLGAISYAELGARMPRSGGEYYYLTQIYHPLAGYLSGWISLTVGFTASIALSAMAMGAYLSEVTGTDARWIALAVIVLVSGIHSFHVEQSSRFQNIFTILKLALMVFLAMACLLRPAAGNGLSWSGPWLSELGTVPYAVALVYVVYAYSGWNAAAYITGEVRNPARNLPRALIGGALLVSVLYVLLQMGFLYQAGREALVGKIEVAQIAAVSVFGASGGQTVSLLIGLLLVSSISAMVWVGPRVSRAMAEDYPVWHFLARDNRHGVPVTAIWFQAAVSIFLLLSGSFEQVLTYSGFVLHLSTTAAVAGVFFLRRQDKGRRPPYSSPFYPWAQIIFLVFSVWMLAFLLYDKPRESLLGLLNLGIGSISYWWNKNFALPPVKRK
ncbi:MAG: amino acid permease [Saprospiraceae bacterium]|nr:amino acid permease [Saprospiraceae bacterium]